MKEQIKNYETPEVELVEVYVEKGFGGSDTGGNSDDTEAGSGDTNDDF